MVSAFSIDTANATVNGLFNTTLNATQPTENRTDFDLILEYPPLLKVTSITLCILILVFGVVGNIMVPLVIIRTKDMRNSTNIFLMNLSLADILVLLVCIPSVLVELNSRPETWILGENLCKYTFSLLYFTPDEISLSMKKTLNLSEKKKNEI